MKTTEIPLMLKYMYKTDIGRFGILLGLFYRDTYERGGGMEEAGDLIPNINYYDLADDTIGMLAGLEYSLKINRHVFSLGLRVSSASLLEYGYYDSSEDDDGDFNLSTFTSEILIGYGYNLGGKGDKVQTDENREKWLFPVQTGILSIPSDDNRELSLTIDAGLLYKFTETGYFGLSVLGFSEGAFPLFTAAWTKDPDTIIHSLGFIVVPIQGMTIAAFKYSYAWKRFSIGTMIAGEVADLSNLAYGISAGYYF